MSINVRSLFVALLFGAPLAAQSASPPSGPPRPPQEAVDACAKLADGAACSVAFGDRTVEGICRKPPCGDGPLACMPSAPPPRQ